MTTTNKIRIATADTTNACTLTCSEITAAVRLPVHLEFQEIEGDCLILELRLGSELHAAPPKHLAAAVGNGAPAVEVLSAWNEYAGQIRPKLCRDVLGSLYDDMPNVAHYALDDNLATGGVGPLRFLVAPGRAVFV